MNDKEKALCLMELVKVKVGIKIRELVVRKGELARTISEKETFEKYESEKYVGGFNPVNYTHKISNCYKNCENADIAVRDWQEIQKYCYEKFIKEGV